MRGRRLISLLSGGTALPPWVINGVNPPDIAFDWKNNRVWSKGKGVTQASSLITCSRGSAGTAPDVNGNYVQFGANIPRITSAGLLVEESRTNSIRNNSMQGAVVADGVERTTNGNFALNPINAAQNTVQNGWSWSASGSGSVSYASNTVTLHGFAASVANLYSAPIPTVAGFTYTVTVDIGGTAGMNVFVGSAQFGSDLLNIVSAPVGAARQFQFTATGTNSWLGFSANTGGTATMTVANVSVQSAGATPTGWGNFSPVAGLVTNIVNVGTQNGVNFVDLQYVGTPTGNNFNGTPDNSTTATASQGQTWSASYFLALVAGSFPTGFNTQVFIGEQNGGSFIGGAGGGDISGQLTSTLKRFQYSRTNTLSTTTNNVTTFLNTNFTPGNATNFTLRIGWPQLENNSLINSTVASAVKQANGASGVNGTAVYQVGGGTGTAATLNVTWAAGVLTVNSVANAGSYTVFPTGPAALTYVSGTATGWTGATVTLTPTDNSASAFATSPIITSGAAATRAADVITLTSPPAFGSAYSLYASGTPQAPTGYTIAQSFIDLTNGTSTEFGSFRVTGGTGTFFATGAPSWNPSAGAVSQGLISRTAAATAAGAQTAALNGALAAAGTIAASPVVTNARIGYSLSGANFFDGLLSYTALWASQAIPQAQLQSMTASGP